MKALLDLEPEDCRYPFGDGPIVFCGCPAVAGSSYCLPHKILCTKAPEHHRRGVDAPHFSALVRKGAVPAVMVLADREELP